MVDAVSGLTYDVVAPSQISETASGQASSYDISQFQDFMSQQVSSVNNAEVSNVSEIESTENSGLKQAISMLDSLNGRIEGIGEEAMQAMSGGTDLAPSEVISLTMKAHYFLFQSELTANVANKSSEGVQQLFRQQS